MRSARRLCAAVLIGTALTLAAAATAAAAPLLPLGDALGTEGAPQSVAFSNDGKWLAAALSGPDELAVYGLAEDGRPTLNDTPVAAPDQPTALAFSPTARLLVTANQSTNSLATYGLSSSGHLSPTGFTAPVAEAADHLAFSPDGRLLAAVSERDMSITVFSVAASGLLTPVGAPLHPDLSGTLTDVAFSPQGDRLAVSSGSGSGFLLYGSMAVYFVSADGTLAETGRTTSDYAYASLAFSRNGRFIVATHFLPGSLAVLALGADGTLSPVGPDVPVSTLGALSLAAAPVGDRFALANIGTNTVSPYALANDGTLTQIGPSVAPAVRADGLPDHPNGLAYSPDNTLLAAYSTDTKSIATYAVLRNGKLVPIGDVTPAHDGGAPAAVSDGLFVAGWEAPVVHRLSATGTLEGPGAPTSIGTFRYHVAVLPGFVAMSNGDVPGVRLYRIADFDDLAAVEEPSAIGGTAPADLPFAAPALAYDGRRRQLVAAWGDVLSTFAVSDAGALTPVGSPIDLGVEIRDISVSPDGAYLAANTTSGVNLYALDGDGLASASPTASVGSGPTGPLQFSPDSQVLVTEGPTTYRITDSGALVQRSQMGTSDDVALSPDGRVLAAASGRFVQLYTLSPDGTLTPAGSPTTIYGAVVWTVSPAALAFDTSGRFLLVGNPETNEIVSYPIAAPALDPFVLSGPPPVTTSETAAFGLDATYPSTFACALDGGPSQPCDQAPTFTGVGEGAHTLSVRAADLTGARSSDAATWAWSVDHSPPRAVDLVTPAAGAKALRESIDLTWAPTTDAVTKVDHYVVKVDRQAPRDVAPSQCTAVCAVHVTGLADGDHTWSVGATDTAGNESWSPATSFTVDAAPPGAFDLTGPAAGAVVSDAQPALSWQAAPDAGTGTTAYDVIVDGHVVATVDGSTTHAAPSTPLGDGPHRWTVRALDSYGHERAASATRDLTVDTAPPTADLHVNPTLFVPPYQVTLDASGSTDPGGRIDHYEFDLDGNGTFETVSAAPRAQTTFTTVGAHVVAVRVVDEVGLASTQQATTTGDPGGPGTGAKEASVSIDGGASYTRSLDVSLKISPPPHSGALTMAIANDGAPGDSPKRSVTATVDHWELEKGDGLRDRRIVYVVFYNAAGFEVTNGRVQDDILYDPHPPVVDSAVLRMAGAHTATLKLKAHDRGSGLGALELASGRHRLSRRSRFTRSWHIRVSGRPQHLTVVVHDKAGNIARARVRLARP